MAQILGEWFLCEITFCLLTNEHEEMEAEDESFLSITRQLGAAKEPTEDMAVKVEAIDS